MKSTRSSKVIVAYLFQRQDASNYYYNGLQTGYSPNSLLPNNLQVGNYAVNAVGASYQYSFK